MGIPGPQGLIADGLQGRIYGSTGQILYDAQTNTWPSGPQFSDAATGLTNSAIQQVDGDLWLTANALYDAATSKWNRVDTSKAAFGIQIQGYGTIPGLTTPGVNIWTAAAGTNPIGAFLTEGGWLTVGLLVANQNFVIGGINLEIDGSGNAPYSRMNQLQGVGTYLSRNAFYNGSAWAFDDTSVPASALAILQDGTVQVLSAPAGSTLTWTAINSITTTGQVLSPPTTTLAGTTAGNVYWAQPEQGTRKVFIAVADGYENDTTTNQTITFPAAYTYPPTVSTNTTGLTITVTTTALTITAPDNTTLYNGVVEVIGI